MNYILTLACFGLITGFFVLFKISPLSVAPTSKFLTDITDDKTPIRSSIMLVTKRKKVSYLKREITEIKAILEDTGRGHKFPQITAISSLMFIIGLVALTGYFAINFLGNYRQIAAKLLRPRQVVLVYKTYTNSL